MHVNRKAWLAVIAVLVLSACGGDAINGSFDASGDYTLRTIGGQSLPFTFPNQDPADVTTVNSGDISIAPDGTFTESATVTTVTPGSTTVTTTTCFGTYSVGNGAVFFSEPTQANPNCGGNFAAGWNGSNTLSILIDVGVSAVYTK